MAWNILRRAAAGALVALHLTGVAAAADDAALRGEASTALRKAVAFFRQHVAVEGGYLWRYSEDLSRREGEGKASETTVWVQPPGTPSVGISLLEAYEATGDRFYLDGAVQAAECLVRGQLASGGWDYRVEFASKARARYAYRVEEPKDTAKLRNTSVLDDDTTQAALRLLMRVDRALEFKNERIHEAATYALDRLLDAQYPNGAWPQRFSAPPDAAAFPVLKASYPDAWPRTWPNQSYATYYTFNDNAIHDVVDVMFEAAGVYGDERYDGAARRAGAFMLLSQMPEPQPAWAQQYNAQMQPAWARKFEPPAITGGESQGVIAALMSIYRATGDRKYLEPIPRAIGYLRKSLRSDGRLARFYELKTNRPLYFTKEYELTYDDGDVPTHYSFIVGSRLDSLEREYKRLAAAPAERLREVFSPRTPSAEAVRAAIAALDDRGRWVEDGRLKYHGSDDTTRQIIDCQTFNARVRTLAGYLRAQPRSAPDQ
jgi:hypothetical protein